MNQHLQNILSLIQQNEDLTVEQKAAITKSLKDADKELEITAFKLDRTEKVKRTTAILLEETIEELEQKRKAVEAQNKELEIETALERVRTVAMSMMKPDDLLEISKIQFNELKQLGFAEIRNALIGIFHDDQNFFSDYDYSDFSGGAIAKIPYHKNKVVDDAVNRMKSSTDAFTEFVVEGKELEEWKAFRKQNGEYDDARLANADSLYYYFYSIESGNIGISTFKKISEEQLNILRRFRNVFDLAYKRYVDISKAEAQAREAQIELSLERVRARAMAMQHSDELAELVSVVFKELTHLDFVLTSCILWIDNPELVTDALWMASSEMNKPPRPYFIKPFHHSFFKSIIHAWKEKDPKWVYTLAGDEKNSFQESFFNEIPDLPDAFKNALSIPEQVVFSASFNNFGALEIVGTEPLPDEKFEILHRFGRVFDLSYTRFNDLQKAEAQAREAQIEAALERVRSRSMGMQKSEELKEVIRIVYQQLTHLKINLDHAGFVVDYSLGGDWHFWIADEQDIPSKITHPYFESVWAKQFNEAKEKGADFFATHLNFEEKNKFYKEFLSFVTGLPEASKDFYLSCPGLAASTVLLENVGLYIENFSGTLYTDEENTTLMRFGKVFQQTYTRFLDLQKAEAQAREAQIEAALERVRAKSMSMQRSNELQDAAMLLAQQVKTLGVPSFACGFNIWDDDMKEATAWMAGEDRLQPAFKTSSSEDAFLRIHESAQKGEQLFVAEQRGEELEAHYRYMATIPEFKAVMDKMAEAGLSVPAFQIIHCAFFSQGYLMFISFDPVPEAHDIFKRFAKVFEQTYTRFLDLQKAEAQAREAKIEAALEKARARTMGMQSSDELPDVANVLFLEIQALGIPAWSCGYNILAEDKTSATCWMSSEGTLQLPFKLRLFGEASFAEMGDFIRSEQTMLVQELGDKALEEHYAYMKSFPDLKPTFDQIDELGLSLPTYQINHLCKFTQGFLLFITYEKVPDSHDIFKRFTKVFEQTYTRFLDLQKAEAQAREAQIEAALERVRSRSMAMHKSDELLEAGEIIFVEMQKLGIESLTAGYVLIDKEEKNGLNYTPHPGTKKIMPVPVIIPHNETSHMQQVVENWKKGNPFFMVEMDEDETIKHQTFIAERSTNFPLTAAQLIAISPARLFLHNFFFKEGYILIVGGTKLSAEQIDIMLRFAKVFQQTYTRFLDLKKAEAQAKEAQIETALEKVRSRTLAMQKSDELAETAAVLFQQLIALGIEPNRLYIAIVKDENGESEFWITEEDGTKISTAFAANLNQNISFAKMYDGWKQQQKSLVIDMQGEELQNYFRHLSSLGVPFKGGLEQKRRVQDIAYFSKGFIGIASPEEQPRETLQLLERFAAVFNLTFTRFNDLKVAEAHALQAEQDLVAIKEAKQKAEEALSELQSTQKQLIQSEKMASLGELTAGIAHEIQNPLNFVNNFSEVSRELLDEMREAIEKGDTEEAKEIMNDVIQNLEKINHHGKRADGIVKGMLQHSRSSSSAKEPTDINALADEYLRLAYHGLRAKDKTFNATLKTDFDETIGNINIIPQDIGRVILNLITNAFYVVAEKKKENIEGYEPTVSVSTKKEGNNILISVKDNGNGIPPKVLDKIFQPFFTTKPTGQGTGLGLSLSYDIVKAHGGELKVETTEGEGTVFIIQLPAN